jgi:hypothetical protein
VSKAQFQLAFDGDAVRTGMDVYELAPSLLSVGDLVRDVNRYMNQERATVSLQVRSDFRRASFEISLVLDQSMVEHAKEILFGAAIIDAKTLVETIFGTIQKGTDIITGIFRLYKMLKGRKPREIMTDRSTTIIQYNGGQINVEPHTAQLYMNDAVRGELDRFVRPVAGPGIDTLEIRQKKKTVERISKDDLPERVITGDTMELGDPAHRILSSTREARLRVVKANFEKGKWGFSDGTTKFGADIHDPGFQGRLDAREIGFYKGDVLRVLLRTVQTLADGGRFTTTYHIDQVLEHIPGLNQMPLLSTPKARRGPKRGQVPPPASQE